MYFASFHQPFIVLLPLLLVCYPKRVLYIIDLSYFAEKIEQWKDTLRNSYQCIHPPICIYSPHRLWLSSCYYGYSLCLCSRCQSVPLTSRMLLYNSLILVIFPSQLDPLHYQQTRYTFFSLQKENSLDFIYFLPAVTAHSLPRSPLQYSSLKSCYTPHLQSFSFFLTWIPNKISTPWLHWHCLLGSLNCQSLTFDTPFSLKHISSSF